MSWNDIEITPRGNARMRYDALQDDCRFRGDDWGKSVVQYTTDKAARLPVADIAVRDANGAEQEFWVEIGAACFS